jgi:DnaK suppressor protein
MISHTHPPSALSAAQLEQIREELLRTLRRIERTMEKAASARPAELDQSSIGRLSRIEALQNQSMTQGLQERDRVQLAQVHDALLRLDEGRYGACSECGAAIQPERLLVFPEAPTCARCSK